MFADTRMSFGDHIEDLRTHLLRALKGFVIGMVLAFGRWAICARHHHQTVVDQLNAFERRKVRKDFTDIRQRVEDSGIIVRPINVRLVHQ